VSVQRFYGHEQHMADALSAACLDMQLALEAQAVG